MNRLHLGWLLLALILTVSALTGFAIDRIHTGIADTLDQAAQSFQPALASQALTSWKRWRGLTAAMTDHEPLENMDLLFEQLSQEYALQHPEEFSNLCLQLSCVSRAISESVRLTWWNFL